MFVYCVVTVSFEMSSLRTNRGIVSHLRGVGVPTASKRRRLDSVIDPALPCPGPGVAPPWYRWHMRFSTEIVVARPPERVWAFLWDVERVAKCLPGCREARTVVPHE